MAGTTDKTTQSPWMARGSAPGPQSAMSQDPLTGKPLSARMQAPAAPAEFGLMREERHALMAAFLLGRRLGAVGSAGALGQLARDLAPQGVLHQLAEAYCEAGRGNFTGAAARVASLPLRDRSNVARRDEAIAKLRAFGRLAPGRSGG